MSFSLAEIADRIGIDIRNSGAADLAAFPITGINSPQQATDSEITFVVSEKYLQPLQATRAAAVVLSPGLVSQSPVPVLEHEQPYVAYAQLTSLFAPTKPEPGVHPTATIEENALIGDGVSIAANVVIGSRSRIGDGAVIGPNVSIGPNAVIGAGTRLHANVSIYHDVSIGTDCIVHSGSVIGSDGFGFAPTAEGWLKIHQLGRVRVGNAVEIGANCAIDRGALGDTVIADGVKIDNLVMMAHNVQIGENTAIAGQVGIAGSSKIGKNCMFAGQAGVAGHVEITDNVQVTGQGMITKSITVPGTYSSGTSFSESKAWRRNTVRFNMLDSIYKRLVALEKTIKKKN